MKYLPCGQQSKSKADKKKQAILRVPHDDDDDDDVCQLCRAEIVLNFEPPSIECTHCRARIKPNEPYRAGAEIDMCHYVCKSCYEAFQGETIEVHGQSFSKTKLKERINERWEEWWIQCVKCENWQHRICALYNSRCECDDNGRPQDYICPYCYVREVESGSRKPLPRNAVLGAKDLPTTALSDHIEDRLSKRLERERRERASAAGRQSLEKVAGAEDLVVRVVSSVDKKLEVKPRFLETFGEDNYPAEFPYKSKAIFLFQKIEGVEVCLFGMFVQEFGADCSSPNQWRVCLSCLDYVGYLRPEETQTVSGEDLSTFVYHEILIGYLQYCKLRGFTSCCIRARPPLKEGEDSMFSCNPEFQNTSNPDKLREWYLSMLQKAIEEEIVVGLTNLYDHFFVTTGERKAKITATRLPYSDDDYWSRAEDIITQLQQEGVCNMKGKTNNINTKRDFEAAESTDGLSGSTSMDAMLMQRLGEIIYPMKKDFIEVHLQYSCSQCCTFMVSGKRWVCQQCKNFCICDKCYDAEQQLEEREKHPSGGRHAHTLQQVDIAGVPKDTADRDGVIKSEFSDTREAFLELCHSNNYRFDTLRRAKHSSMMVLHHLHNPPPELVTPKCCFCRDEIEFGRGWQCQICPDFDVCKDCYLKEVFYHGHLLIPPLKVYLDDQENAEARQLRIHRIRQMQGTQHAAPTGANSPTARRSRNYFSTTGNVKPVPREGVKIARK